MDKIKKQLEEQIKQIGEEGLQSSNVEYLGKLIDIHKDILNEEYWKIKEENYMRYRESGAYGAYEENYGRRGVKGTGRGRRRYRENGYNYGYDGGNYGEDDKEEAMEMMREHYNGYREGMSYGAERESMESLNAMLQSAYEFIQMLSEDAKSQQEAELVKKWARKIGQI